MGWIIIVLWVGICAFALMFTIFLIKPLFSFTRSKEADDSVEIKREDCPELFMVIDDIVKHTGCKKPKHVYLSADVNACVFFNSSFWSIFFPVRKNLKIGLGLFEGLNIDELKSILAHEFGHFSQKSMKIGSTVYVINQVLYNMTYTQDFWDKMLDAWCSSSYSPWAITGGLTRWFTNGVKRMNVSMYRFVERGYRKLSRQMEYDADNVSCSYVGSEVFVSGMCKTDVNTTQNSMLIDALKSLINENKVIDDIFEAYRIAMEELPDGYRIDLDYRKLMNEPHEQLRAKSRISIEGTWDSHPELSARIHNARKNGYSAIGGETIKAWTLISEEISRKVSDLFLNQIEGRDKLQHLSTEEFREWINSYFVNNLYKPELRPFFARRIVPFDLEITESQTVANPFTERNREIVEEFLVASSDWTLLNQVNSKERDVDYIEYDGREVTRKTLPNIIRLHKQYYEELLNKLIRIDRRVYLYLMQEAKSNEEREEITYAYQLLFYADFTKNTNLANLFAARDEINEELTDTAQSAIRTESDIESLRQEVVKYVDYLKKSIEEMNMNAIGMATDDDYVQKLNSILSITTLGDQALNGEFLNAVVISIPQELYHVHQILENMAKAQICKYAVLCEKSTNNEEEDCSGAEGERISVADYVVEQKDDQTIGAWILFFIYSAIIITLFYLNDCEGNSYSDTSWSSSSTSVSTYTDSQTDDTPFNIIDRNADDMTIPEESQYQEGEIRDELVSLILPNGVYAKKIDFNNGSYAYDLCDNKEQQNYVIRFISSTYSDFNDLGFETVWKQAKEQNEEGNVSASYGNLEKKSIGNKLAYSRTTIYHGESDTEWKFIVLCDDLSDKVVILSSWSIKGTDVPLNEILAKIRF